MISKKTVDALNKQVNAELYSSYLYLSMSAYFESIDMKGLASWMRVQAAEELVHAMKMYDYVISAGGRAELLSVEAPQKEWKSPLDAFQNVYDHERKVTGLIKALAEVAAAERDRSTQDFLAWYLDEQVEEEESSDSGLKKIMAAGDDPAKIQSVSSELSQRRFKFPRGYTVF